MKVWMYVDPFGVQTLEKEPADEYAEIEQFLQGALPDTKLHFRRDVMPPELENGKPDVYLFDIGGLCYTDYSGTQRLNFCSLIVRQVKEHPNTLFVPWTDMTRDYWKFAVEELLPEISGEPNAFCPDTPRWEDEPFRQLLTQKLQEWAGVKP